MFAIPFTQSGKAHGDLQHQYKRRVTLTTSHAFPYLKSRIDVIDREEVSELILLCQFGSKLHLGVRSNYLNLMMLFLETLFIC